MEYVHSLSLILIHAINLSTLLFIAESSFFLSADMAIPDRILKTKIFTIETEKTISANNEVQLNGQLKCHLAQQTPSK